MDFTYTEDQLLFRESVREFLVNEVTCEKIRALWETDTGRSDELWQQLAELGLTGITVPEDFGGLGMSALDFVLLAQEAGYVALPANLVETVLVSVPLIAAVKDEPFKANWLTKIAAGEAKVAIGLEQNLLVEDAHIADLLIMQQGSALYALDPGKATLTFNASVDASRRLYAVSWSPTDATCIAEGDDANHLVKCSINRGALACAAQALGLSQRMIDLSVDYTSERQQFGKPIGSFQAVKHRMANVAVALEYAKAPVAYAAYAISNDLSTTDKAVSHAKSVACDAALIAAKNSIQVHGAMGYTWEVDLHIFMKKAWALDKTWGDQAFHKQRVADAILADTDRIGAGFTFINA